MLNITDYQRNANQTHNEVPSHSGQNESESELIQSFLTLCDSMDCSPPFCFVYGIFQAGILEWVAISFSRGSSWLRNQTRVSCIAGRFFTNWAIREALIMAAIQKSTRNKCWRGCGEKGTLLHCWWEWKLVQPQWRTVWRLLKKTGNRTAIQPSNPTAGHTHWGNQNWKRRVPQYSSQHCLQ